MGACNDKPWSMTLVTDDDEDKTELEFKNVKVRLGHITGDVYLEGTKVSALTGTCRPILERVTQIDFQFSLETVEIFLGGLALEQKDANVFFHGGFRAFDPSSPPRTPQGTMFIPDSGDTGTGNGMQAQ